MKLVEIKDVRSGQVLERDRCLFVIGERTGVHNFVVSLYNYNRKPSPNDAYELLATHEKNIGAFECCKIIGKIGITHCIEERKLVEIPRTAEFQTDDVIEVHWEYGIEIDVMDGVFAYLDPDFIHKDQIKKVGILGVTHEFVNDRVKLMNK